MDMKVFLDHPCLHYGTYDGLEGYKGLLLVNEKSFKIKLLKTTTGWIADCKQDTNNSNKQFLELLNSKNYQQPAEYLHEYYLYLKQKNSAYEPVPHKIYSKVLKEYKEFCNFYIHIEHVELSSDFSKITVIYVDDKFRNHEITIKVNYNVNSGKLFQIARTELPVNVCEWSDDSLITLFAQFTEEVQCYQLFFDVMDIIDFNMWVVDPKIPKRSDVKRRVMLAENLSAIINIHPKYPFELPVVEVLGPQSKTQTIQSTLEKNIDLWDQDGDILENLLKFFDVALFPQPHSLANEAGIAPCGICLSDRDDSAELPEVYCSHSPCDQGFHHDCLKKYLQQSVQDYCDNKLVGKCPYCKLRITYDGSKRSRKTTR